MKDVKQVIVLRKDLNMRKGKMVAQGAHAAIAAYDMAKSKNKTIVDFWRLNGYKKVCVGCESAEELQELCQQAQKAKLPWAHIIDSGHTEFKGKPTQTAIAIGPGPSELIDKITGHLKLL